MAIIDSTCLIYLAKTGKLNLLKQIYKKVFIPKAVYKEIILKGKEKGFADAIILEKAINKELIEVKELKKRRMEESRELCEIASIGKGEAEAIVLAKDMKQELVIDDLVANNVAKMFGIETLWTTSLILKALHENILKKSDARETIEDMVKNGYWLSEDVLLKIIKEIERYKK